MATGDFYQNNDLGTFHSAASHAVGRAEWKRLRRLDDVLIEIVSLTDCDSPGIYEPDRIREINDLARTALERPIVAKQEWFKYSKAQEDHPVERPRFAAYVFQLRQVYETMLNTLSGDLNHDNVAAVKEMLKSLLKEENNE